MKKTIGGQRLGSGNKMEVDTKTFNRSTFNLNKIFRTTMAPGTLVPIYCKPMLPGDTFDIDLDAYVNTLPTIGPLFGSKKLQIDVFQIPIRLYQKLLHQNKQGIGLKMNTVKLPQVILTALGSEHALDYTKNLDNQQINPSALFSYLNIRGIGDGGVNGAQRLFNAIPLLGYWDVYKQYYANKQEEIGVFISSTIQINKTITTIDFYQNESATALPLPEAPAGVYKTLTSTSYLLINNTTQPQPEPRTIKINVDGKDYALDDIFDNVTILDNTRIQATQPKTKWIAKIIKNWRYLKTNEILETEPQLQTFPLTNIDDIKDAILAHPGTSPFLITDATPAPYGTSIPGLTTTYSPLLTSQEGLGIKTYQSDLFNNWMSTEWLDGTNGINEITRVDTTDGSFKIETLILAKKVYEMLNDIAISGGSYNDWIEVVYEHQPFRKAENPIYEGGLIKEIVFEEVISNSQATGEDGQQPLGTLAGKGRLNSKHKGGQITVKADEISYLMIIASITPRVDYSQGNDWDVHLQTLDDFHKPHLSQIGFQDLICEQMAWWDSKFDYGNTDTWIQHSAGKQPAWLNYMTEVNTVRGDFAIEDNSMFMVLNRRYENDTNGKIKDLTTYIDPVKFNQIFAQTKRDAQNYWVQVGLNITARRKMSSRIMPNL